MFKAFTDGGARPNPGFGRFAYVIASNTFKELSYYQSDIHSNTTNNEMELSAIIKVLEDFGPKLDTVYSDSSYCVMGINVWSKTWANKDYTLKPGVYRPNRLLWKRISLLRDTYPKITFVHIKAHTGKSDLKSLLNDRADKLCALN